MRSISTNYSRNPQQKVIDLFFHIFLSLIVSSRRHGLQMANKPTKCCLVRGLVKQATAIKNRGKWTEKNCNAGRTFSREYDCLAKIGIRKPRSHCYWETRSNVKGQHEPTRTDNQRQKYMNKIHLLLRILALIGRYGSHLMIVMIFVTQNNF